MPDIIIVKGYTHASVTAKTQRGFELLEEQWGGTSLSNVLVKEFKDTLEAIEPGIEIEII